MVYKATVTSLEGATIALISSSTSPRPLHLLVAPQLLCGELQRQAALLHRAQHDLRDDRSQNLAASHIGGVDKRNL